MKLRKIMVILLACVVLSGCWDNVEIDRKSFISTIGIDAGKDISKIKKFKNIKSGEAFSEKEFKKLNITYAFPNISELGSEKGGNAESKQIEVEAYSMEDGVIKATAKSSRNIHLGHTKLLIISEDVLKYETTFKEIVDYFQRNPFLNRMMYVAVCKGKAKDYVKYKPQMEKNLENYFTGLMENSKRVSTIIPVKLNEFLTNIGNNGNAILPRLEYDKNKGDVSLEGVSVIKNYMLKGDLNEDETSYLEILRGKIIGGKRAIYKNGHPIDFIIDGVQRKISFTHTDFNNLNFNIDIKLEGFITNYYNEGKKISNEDIIEMQQNFNKLLSTQCEKVAKLTQRKLNVDIIGLSENMKSYHPIIWNKIRSEWEEKYEKSKIKVNVKIAIRRIGISN